MPWNAAGRWIPEDDSVATRLTGLLDSNSGYIQAARGAGQRTAGRRGLFNSSLAAGAGQAAAISAAAPIAAQDAQQTFSRNQAVLEGGLQYDNNSRLAEQQQGFTRENQRFAQGTQFELQGREAGFQRERDLLAQQGATATQLREFDQRTAEQIRGQSGQLTLQEREAGYQRERDVLAQQGATAQQLREFDQRTAEQVRGFGAQESLTRLQQSGQSSILAQEAEIQRQRDTFAQQGATAAQLREFDQRAQEQIRGIEAAATSQTAQLSSAERIQAANNDGEVLRSQIAANSQLSSNYLNAFSQLADQQNIPADVRAAYITEMQRVTQQGQNLIAVTSTVPLTWGAAPTAPAAPAPAPAPAYDPALNTAQTTPPPTYAQEPAYADPYGFDPYNRYDINPGLLGSYY